jgi:hypothetical protein
MAIMSEIWTHIKGYRRGPPAAGSPPLGSPWASAALGIPVEEDEEVPRHKGKGRTAIVRSEPDTWKSRRQAAALSTRLDNSSRIVKRSLPNLSKLPKLPP